MVTPKVGSGWLVITGGACVCSRHLPSHWVEATIHFPGRATSQEKPLKPADPPGNLNLLRVSISASSYLVTYFWTDGGSLTACSLSHLCVTPVVPVVLGACLLPVTS